MHSEVIVIDTLQFQHHIGVNDLSTPVWTVVDGKPQEQWWIGLA